MTATVDSHEQNPYTKEEQDFYAACKQHDLTYCYSDDFTFAKAGHNSFLTLQHQARNLPRAKEIWNRVVDEKLSGSTEETKSKFYW